LLTKRSGKAIYLGLAGRVVERLLS
jgi:hypothetical protein